MSSSQPTPQGLRVYPPEIRIHIYEAACVFDGKIPDLIKALRQDSELYKEAMNIFLKSSAYVLHAQNRWSFGLMTATAISRIQRLHIIIDKDIASEKGEFSLTTREFIYFRLSGLKHLTFEDNYPAPDPATHIAGTDHQRTLYVYFFMYETLCSLYAGSTVLRSITWVTRLTAEETEGILLAMEDSLEKFELTVKTGKDGTTEYTWETKGDAALELGPLTRLDRPDGINGYFLPDDWPLE